MANTPGSLPKAAGNIVYGADYNTVQAKVRQVLGDGNPYGPGTGTPSWGYNITLNSSAVSSICCVTKQQWDNLDADVNKAYCHVNGSSYSGYASSVSGNISTATINTANIAMDSIMTGNNRFATGTGQLSKVLLVRSPAAVQPITAAAFTASKSFTIEVYFTSANNMQYFFNQGGIIHIEGVAPTQSTTQDANWKALLEGMLFQFTAISNTTDGTFGSSVGFNALSSSVTTNLYKAATGGSGAYASNYVTIKGIKNSTSLTFTLDLFDAHVGSGGGPDNVSEGAGYYIYGSKAAASFTGTNPTTN
jgi:hypothetical protein